MSDRRDTGPVTLGEVIQSMRTVLIVTSYDLLLTLPVVWGATATHPILPTTGNKFRPRYLVLLTYPFPTLLPLHHIALE